MTTRIKADLKKRLFRIALRQALMRPCPNSVPRSGDEGKSVNCFVAYANTDNSKPYLLLDSLDGDLVKCRLWKSGSFSVETEEPVRNLIDLKLQIVHYYGLDRIEYTGTWDFLLHHYSRFVYVQILARRAWHAVCQFVFNRRSLASQERLRILRLLISRRLAGNAEGLSSWDVMTELYSIRWIDHPAGESRNAAVEFQLESLVVSGELAKDGITYSAVPKSLVTLDQADEQDRRHRESSRLQLWIVILTLILAVAAVVQAGIVRVPTVLDFTSKR